MPRSRDVGAQAAGGGAVALPGPPSTLPEARAHVDFDQLVAAEKDALLGLAFALTGSRAAAEDLTQEAFLRLHQRWARVATYDRPGAWLRRVVLNLATSRARRLAAEARAIARLGREGRVSHRGLGSEAAEFWSAVRELPRRQRQVLALYYVEDRPVSDVAEILGLAEGTVRAALHQGREHLRVRFGAPSDEETR